MRWRVAAIVRCPLLAGCAGQRQADDDALAASIVEKADRVRFPAEGFEVGVTITTTTPAGPAEPRKYRVLSKGNENTVVMTVEPAAERGQIMLMKGHDLWVFLPSVSQPVRLPASQRLTGIVANGDLARANFAGDYKPQLLSTETVDGEAMYVLELTAVDRSVTYHRVLYWVRQSNQLPVQGRVLLAVRSPAEDLPLPEIRKGGRPRASDAARDAGRAAQGRGVRRWTTRTCDCATCPTRSSPRIILKRLE